VVLSVSGRVAIVPDKTVVPYAVFVYRAQDGTSKRRLGGGSARAAEAYAVFSCSWPKTAHSNAVLLGFSGLFSRRHNHIPFSLFCLQGGRALCRLRLFSSGTYVQFQHLFRSCLCSLCLVFMFKFQISVFWLLFMLDGLSSC